MKKVIVACNLKPAKLRGIESAGMVIAASFMDAENKRHVEVLEPVDASVAPGTEVVFDGLKNYARNPDAVLNPKQKVFEKCATHMVLKDGKVLYRDALFMAGGQPLKVKSLVHGNIS